MRVIGGARAVSEVVSRDEVRANLASDSVMLKTHGGSPTSLYSQRALISMRIRHETD